MTPKSTLCKSLQTVKEKVESASKDAHDRAELVMKADQDPKLGWKTLTKYDEAQRQGPKDAEKDKLWASCSKQVQEGQKKTKPPISQPFRHRPGFSSGSNFTG